MIQRKSTSRLIFLLPFIFVAFFLAAYNMVILLVSYINSETSEMSKYWDPVVSMPSSTNKQKPKFHVAVTATGFPYNQWQCRIMYYWYKKMRDKPGSDMGKFTRILHSGNPDGLMNEMPTFVVKPLPDGLDKGYVVLNRPYAFVQWLESAIIEEEYILMGEPDHIIVNPIPNLAAGGNPAAYHFFYIEPAQNEGLLRKYYPAERGPISDIDPIGNSPVIIKKRMLEEVAPTWVNVSLEMKGDAETDKAFGWVLEMYAYAVASALHGVRHILRNDFMIQPPFDLELGKAFIIHYTYGCDYNMKGDLTYGKIGEWRFDKRSHVDGPPPRNISMPPHGAPNSVIQLVTMVNEASANIPNWDLLP